METQHTENGYRLRSAERLDAVNVLVQYDPGHSYWPGETHIRRATWGETMRGDYVLRVGDVATSLLPGDTIPPAVATIAAGTPDELDFIGRDATSWKERRFLISDAQARTITEETAQIRTRETAQRKASQTPVDTEHWTCWECGLTYSYAQRKPIHDAMGDYCGC